MIGVAACAAQLQAAPLSNPKVGAQPAQAPVLKKTLQGTVGSAGQAVRLEVQPGQVVQLRWEGAGLQLDLRDAQGQHVRRLAQDGKGVQTAMWLSQGPAHEQLWLSPSGKWAPGGAALPYTLQVLNTWATQGMDRPTPENTPMGQRLQALQQALARGESSEAFWREVQAQGTPWVEPWGDEQLLVTFLWRDQGNQNVRLFGSPSGDHNPLRKLEGSDVWWTSVVMDPRARLSYALAPDVPKVANAVQQRRMILTTLQRDPLNAHTFPADAALHAVDRYQGRSALVLAQAPQQPWVKARVHQPQGTLQRHSVDSAILGNRRDVWTYVPAGRAPQALLVLFDAHAFVHDVPTPRILDNLIADGLLPNTAAVIVGNASPEARSAELPPNPLFARFMAEELMPWVQQQGLSQLARRTVVAGSSYGGLVSSYLGLTHPELFGNVLSMSGSYWWAPKGEAAGWMQRAWQALPNPMPHVRFYLDAGTFETSRAGREGIVETNRALGSILRGRGLSVTQREFMNGHDYLQWQGSLGCGLVALLAPERGRSASWGAACDGVTGAHQQD